MVKKASVILTIIIQILTNVLTKQLTIVTTTALIPMAPTYAAVKRDTLLIILMDTPVMVNQIGDRKRMTCIGVGSGGEGGNPPPSIFCRVGAAPPLFDSLLPTPLI